MDSTIVFPRWDILKQDMISGDEYTCFIATYFWTSFTWKLLVYVDGLDGFVNKTDCTEYGGTRILFAYLCNKCITECAVFESSPVVGSSRNNTEGCVINSMPMFVLFLSPPEIPRRNSVPTYKLRCKFVWIDSCFCLYPRYLVTSLCCPTEQYIESLRCKFVWINSFFSEIPCCISVLTSRTEHWIFNDHRQETNLQSSI